MPRMYRILVKTSKATTKPRASGEVVKEKTRESVRRLLQNQVPENSPTFKKIGNHVLVGVRVDR